MDPGYVASTNVGSIRGGRASSIAYAIVKTILILVVEPKRYS